MRESDVAALGDRWRWRAKLAGAILVLAAAPAPASLAKPAEPPIVVVIGGGSVDSAAFRWSSALSELLSRPPGLPDCDPGELCGVPGVVASAQTFDDSTAILKALSDGQIAMAVIPAIPLYRATCKPPRNGPPARLTVLKLLYRQPLYIVVRAGPKPIAKPSDWAGKTIVSGIAGSDSEALALALIEAYGLQRAKIRLLRLPITQAATALKTGAAAAGLFIGHVSDATVADLTGKGLALMSLPDTPERSRLLKLLPVLEPSAIVEGTFPGVAATSTVAQPVAWAAGPGLPEGLAGRLVAAESEPRIVARLEERVEPAPAIPEAVAFMNLPAPAADGVTLFAVAAHKPINKVPCASEAR
jgi:TRAP-type uncharacterized transport system substrate-binding protein